MLAWNFKQKALITNILIRAVFPQITIEKRITRKFP